MNPIRRIRRIAGVLAGLACAWLGLAIAAPAAFAARSVPPPGSGSAGITLPPEPPGWNKHPPLPGQAAAAADTTNRSPADSPPRWPRTSTSWRPRPRARSPPMSSSPAACRAGRSP